MKTRGTANLTELTDEELRHFAAAAALDIYEGSIFGEYEFTFALETFDRYRTELRQRHNARIGNEPTELVRERVVFHPAQGDEQAGFHIESVIPRDTRITNIPPKQTYTGG